MLRLENKNKACQYLWLIDALNFLYIERKLFEGQHSVKMNIFKAIVVYKITTKLFLYNQVKLIASVIYHVFK